MRASERSSRKVILQAAPAVSSRDGLISCRFWAIAPSSSLRGCEAPRRYGCEAAVRRFSDHYPGAMPGSTLLPLASQAAKSRDPARATGGAFSFSASVTWTAAAGGTPVDSLRSARPIGEPEKAPPAGRAGLQHCAREAISQPIASSTMLSRAIPGERAAAVIFSL